jgi:predicted Zn-ribbon and HTH transcriptional regulator
MAEEAECSECGFAFHGRERIDKPSRCPVCKSEDIREARYEIRAEGL